MIHSNYMNMAWDTPKLIRQAKRVLKHQSYDALVGTGLSGTMVVPLLAHLLKKRFAIVRKEDDRSTHSSHRIEGNLEVGDRWIFVDDFVSSGDTRDRVIGQMNFMVEETLEYVGQYMYNDVTAYPQLGIFTAAE